MIDDLTAALWHKADCVCGLCAINKTMFYQIKEREEDAGMNDERESKHFRFGEACGLAVNECRTHRELVARLFQLRRDESLEYNQEFVTDVVLPAFKSRMLG